MSNKVNVKTKQKNVDIFVNILNNGYIKIQNTNKFISATDSNGQNIISGTYPVSLVNDSNYKKISIEWETGQPKIDDFKKKSLYGLYNLDYCTLNKDDFTLIINDDNTTIKINL